MKNTDHLTCEVCRKEPKDIIVTVTQPGWITRWLCRSCFRAGK